ncbi:MAG: DUF692 domain-containing protein [Halothiobacillaceae bacterium]|nr:MAG: DUF692 domain-containing protein [Halothiobacillaceae bacterium]
MKTPARDPEGAGLGLRLSMLGELLGDDPSCTPAEIGFFEIAPEQWMGVGGECGQALRRLTQLHAFVGHGFSLDLGGHAPLNTAHLRALRRFLDLHHIALYTEHLAFIRDGGRLHEVLPRTEAAARHVASRIQMAQDELGQRIGIGNASTFVGSPLDAMTEDDFIVAVTEAADCALHLDVNNVYVNATNHGYDPYAWIDHIARSIPRRVACLHVAGHRRVREDLLIDTHGEAVAAPVWALLDHAYARLGALPTLLERDVDIPPIRELLPELRFIRALQARHADRSH